MIFGFFAQATDDPGRREYGTGGTRFVAPAFHEGNTLSEYVRGGDRVVDAYKRAGLAEITPPEGMLPCIHTKMTIYGRWREPIAEDGRVPNGRTGERKRPNGRNWVIGYLRDKRLQDSLVRCRNVFAQGPPIGEEVTANRIILTSGLVLPSLVYQAEIKAFLDQGVSLERAYFYTGQEMIAPKLLLPCMESMIQGGESLTNAAVECEKMPPVTLPIPVNGEEEPKKADSNVLLIGGFILGVVLLNFIASGRR